MTRMGENHPGLHIKDGNLRSCTEQEQAIGFLQPSAFIINTGPSGGQEGLRVSIHSVLCPFLCARGQKDKSICYFSVHWQFLATTEGKIGLHNTLSYGWPKCTTQGRGEIVSSAFPHQLSMWEPLDLPLPVTGPSISCGIPGSAVFLIMLKESSL